MVDELTARLHMFTLESIKNNLGYDENNAIYNYYEDRYLDTLQKLYDDILKNFEE